MICFSLDFPAVFEVHHLQDRWGTRSSCSRYVRRIDGGTMVSENEDDDARRSTRMAKLVMVSVENGGYGDGFW